MGRTKRCRSTELNSLIGKKNARRIPDQFCKTTIHTNDPVIGPRVKGIDRRMGIQKKDLRSTGIRRIIKADIVSAGKTVPGRSRYVQLGVAKCTVRPDDQL